ncbi:MAG: NAD(P)/FAD-dependent oxidoreductase, partial [Campylobacteraceae bacterium]|nr:NAD(P)/FAD-dependent oxidoreductase [Campylobacteraceae bacterium]
VFDLQSKKQKDLYFLGEALDVTGELGGYNFQWAFSSAFVCAKNIV